MTGLKLNSPILEKNMKTDKRYNSTQELDDQSEYNG